MAAGSITLHIKQMTWSKLVNKVLIFKPVYLLLGYKKTLKLYVLILNKGIRYKIGNGKWNSFEGKFEIDWNSGEKGRG